MKITRLEPILLSVQPSQPIRWSGGVIQFVHASLVRVHTDEGVTGLGETYTGIFAPRAVVGIVESLAPLIIGEDPRQVAALAHKLRSKTLFWARNGAGMSVIGAIEAALWDIVGKVRGLPVYELLGGKTHERLAVYASGGLEKPVEETVQEMQEYERQGFKAVKVRIGMNREADMLKVRRVREALGPDIQLMVDAVQGHNPDPWSASEAIRVGRELEPFDVAWFEEPCAATDYAGYAQVRKHVRIPIAGGESSTSIHEFRNFFEAQALDIAQPDTAHAGGILETRKIATIAESYGVKVVFHSWASSVVLAPNYHLAFATPNSWILEYPTWGYPLRDDLFIEPLRIEDGYLYPPKSPGLGVELTEEIRKKCAFREEAGVLMERAYAAE